jgi:hypothetical protein
MPSTYSTIATVTLGSAAASHTFSSIPGTYTDLVLIAAPNTSLPNLNLYFNSDTSALYSNTGLWGLGSGNGGSGRDINSNYFFGTYSTGTPFQKWNIMNYSNTNTFKPILLRVDDTGLVTGMQSGVYRSTNAITSITLIPGSGNLPSGFTASLYGIAAA